MVNVLVEFVSVVMCVGEIDLVFGYVLGFDVGCVSEILFVDEYVCVVCVNYLLGKVWLICDDLIVLCYVYVSINVMGYCMVE